MQRRKIKYSQTAENTPSTKRIDGIFLWLFFVLLFIPMLNISVSDISQNENRALAKYPTLYTDGHLNQNYTYQFDKWFSDHFGSRQILIGLYSKLKYKIDPIEQNPQVLFGDDDWLFYTADNSLDNFQNKTLFRYDELESASKYLSDIQQWATKNNKAFYYLIAPDKNKIYGEHITSLKKIRPDEESRANQLVKYLRANTAINVIYPYTTLLNNKEKGLLYYKHDSHWNALGAYFVYREIIENIQKDFKQINPVTPYKIKPVFHETGDLSKLLNYAIPKDTQQYLEPVIEDHSVCSYNSITRNEDKGMKCRNKSKTLRVAVFHDSFTSALKKYYNNTFETVKYEWRWHIIPEDLEYIKENADIIILETAERYIFSLLSLKFPENE